MKPQLSYFICATPRSGTVLLCDALASTGVAGRPEEYFYGPSEPDWASTWGLKDYSYPEYLEAVFDHGTTPNGVFGVKMMWSLLDRFACQTRQSPHYTGLELSSLLSAVFPNLHYVWLSRENKVAQAVSHWRAIQTGIWHVAREDTECPVTWPQYNFAAIDHLVQESKAHDAAWQQYFADNGIEPFKVIYEDLANRYEYTVYDLLTFLGVPTAAVSIARPRMTQQADAISAEWVRRYLDALDDRVAPD